MFIHVSRVHLRALDHSAGSSKARSLLSCLCVAHPGEQLQINQPSVYDCDVPQSLASLVPALAAVCKGKAAYGRVAPRIRTISNRSVTLTSADGTDFVSFAKGASFRNGMAAVLRAVSTPQTIGHVIVSKLLFLIRNSRSGETVPHIRGYCFERHLCSSSEMKLMSLAKCIFSSQYSHCAGILPLSPIRPVPCLGGPRPPVGPPGPVLGPFHRGPPF